MSTYIPPIDLLPLTKARSVDINAFNAAVVDAFARIPSESDMTNGRINYGIDSGTSNVYIVTLPVAPTGMVDGLTVAFSPKFANTGASNVNVNGLGTVSIRLRTGAVVRPGDIIAGVPLVARYSVATGFFHIDANAQVTGTVTFATPVEDGSPLLKNSADPTKMVQFSLVQLSSGATRIATFPNKDITLGRDVLRTARDAGSNVPLAFANHGAWIDYTGTFVQAFAASAVLQSGWWTFLRNNGTGEVTLDPSGAETIDGLTSFVMYPGEVRFVQCDGTALRSFVISPFLLSSSVSGNFVKPPGYRKFRFTLDGAGSGGGGGAGGGSGSGVAAATTSGGGGGGGASGNPGRRVTREVIADDLPALVAYVVGAGGTAGAMGAGGAASVSGAAGNAGVAGGIGGAGGATSFGGVSDAYYLLAAGGPSAATAAGAGGLASGTNGAGGAAGTESTGAVSFAMGFDQKITVPTVAPLNGVIGQAGQSGTSAGAGGAGGQARPSSIALTVPAAASGGATQAGLTAGNPGTAGANGLPAQGGGGGGGGSGSRSVSPISPAAGNGGAGGAGGVGQIIAEGVT